MMELVKENADGTVSFRCPECRGCSHPATGWALSPRWVLCWSCAIRLRKWVHSWTNKRPPARKDVGAPLFYEAATKFK
jgi:hypothetical protein